jgi:hypothetical protein
MADRKTQIFNSAIALHKAWVDVVNFHHPGALSSIFAEANEARRARRAIEEKYDAAFSKLTALCTLYEQDR